MAVPPLLSLNTIVSKMRQDCNKYVFLLLTITIFCTIVQNGLAQSPSLITLTNSAWRANDSGTDLGISWRDTTYNDTVTGWTNGFGLLGFDTTPAVYPYPFRTTLAISSSRITYYFRTHFQWTNAITNVNLTGTAFVDDGAVFYLNGQERGRVRLPGNPVLFSTHANIQPNEGTPDSLNFGTVPVLPGDNVFAVEVHQNTNISSDIVFGMSLDANIPISLNCGIAQQGTISSAGGRGLYTYAATAGERVRIQMSRGAGVGNPYLELYSPTGSLLAVDDDSAGSPNAGLTATLTNAGVYTVIARDSGSSTFDYTVSLQRVNGSCNATVMACSQSLTNSVGMPGEVDAYTYSAIAGDVVRVQMTRRAGVGNPYLELYGPTGNLIATDNDSAGYPNAAFSAKLTNAGTYTVIARADDSFSASLAFDYTISLQKVNGECNSTVLACGQSLTNSVGVPGEVDAYTYSATAGEVVRVQMTRKAGVGNPYLELYGPTGSLIATDNDSAGYPNAAFSAKLTNAGTYTVIARSDDSYSTSLAFDYAVSLHRITGGCATTLTCGQSLDDAVNVPGDVGAYTYTANAGDVVRVQMTRKAGVGNPFLELYGPTGNLIAVDNDSAGYPNAVFTARLTNAGMYTVIARADDAYSVSLAFDYTVSLQRVNGGCNTQALTCGQSLTNALNPAGKIDAYTYTASAGDVVRIQMTRKAGVGNPFLELYGPMGNLIATDSDLAGAPNARILVTLTNTGVYTVIARGDDSYSTSLAFGYTVSLQRVNGGCNGVALVCGHSLTNTLDPAGKVDPYTYTASAGDVVRVQLTRGANTGNPYLELYSPSGTLIASDDNSAGYPNALLTATLTNGGLYTVIVRGDDSFVPSTTFDYTVSLQRLNGGCNAPELAFGPITSESIGIPGESDAYSVEVPPGDFTLCLRGVTSSLTGYMELYDTNGTLVASGQSEIHRQVTNATTFTLLVRDYSGYGIGGYKVSLQSGTNSCSLLDFVNPTVVVTGPNQGDFFAKGATLPITWNSSDNVGVISQEVAVSSDGGITFPTIIASGLASNIQSFNWSIPISFSTALFGHIRVTASDAAGNRGYGDSMVDFLIVDPAELKITSYTYDQLSQIVGAAYADGSVITYAYDAAGNRTNLTVVAGTLADSDADGIPDSWELSNGLNPYDPTDASADPDGDGLTNLQEYRAETNPHDPASGLRVTAIGTTGTTLRINFMTVSGKNYIVEQADDLNPGSWNPAGPSIAGSGSVIQFSQTNALVAPRRFYRVHLLP
jgi:YD repeat-containing protein